MIKERRQKIQLLDVRSPGEWKHGHIPGAQHVFLPELRERAATIDKENDRRLLRKRLSREPWREHPETGRLQRCSECSRQLAVVEKGGIRNRRQNLRGMKRFCGLIIFIPGASNDR
jgi:rhodanese-related sulfurtransferase